MGELKNTRVVTYQACQEYNEKLEQVHWQFSGFSNYNIFGLDLHVMDVPNELKVDTLENTVFVGISKTAKKEIVMKELEAIFDKYSEPPKTKIRTDKWKYYLIVYDVMKTHPNITQEILADILSKAYPEYLSRVDAKNIGDFYKNALALINGRYRKYLNLEK